MPRPVSETSNFADGSVHKARITYDKTTLKVFLDDGATPATSVSLNLGTRLSVDTGSAFVGFIAETGAAQENTDILTWTSN
jgi:hypothetical protein